MCLEEAYRQGFFGGGKGGGGKLPPLFGAGGFCPPRPTQRVRVVHVQVSLGVSL